MKEEGKGGVESTPTTTKCPFTGMTFLLPTDGGVDRSTTEVEVGTRPSKKRRRTNAQCPFKKKSQNQINEEPNCTADPIADEVSVSDLEINASYLVPAKETPARVSADECRTAAPGNDIGLSGTVTKSLFPYHVMIDSDFRIAQVGTKLPQVLNISETALVRQRLADVFVVTKPGGVKEWNWKWLQLLEGQAFEVEPIGVGVSGASLSFKTTVAHVSTSPCVSMLVMTPEAHNLKSLREMNLTFSDLPLHGAHRDSIFLQEHLNSQMNSALRMEKLSRSLKMEKTLLESMLPSHAAEGLRKGETVVPRLHSDVTFFFSDVVGFTKICNKLLPWQVIEMLNRLYCVMDSLAKQFNLYKVETIGDAYVCVGGMPLTDKQHARNVANFAIAVRHCCQQILSPVDHSPIQLRIGIHTGSCASGIVGSTNPRYCVFGTYSDGQAFRPDNP